MPEPEVPKSTFTRRWKMNRIKPLRGLYQAILRMLLKVFIKKIEIRGLEHVPKTGALIIMMNHVEAFDAALVLTTLGRTDVTPTPKVEALEKWYSRMWLEPFGSVPIHRGAVDRDAIRTMVDLLEHGEALVLMPEGTRSKDAALLPAQDGMMFVASRAHCPVQILPVAALNTNMIKPALRRGQRVTLHMVVGEPFLFQREPGADGRPDLHALTTAAMHRLAALLPPEMRGVYG